MGELAASIRLDGAPAGGASHLTGDAADLWTSAGGELRVALDGRIDNRRELLDRLGGESAPTRAATDAALLGACFARFGPSAFELPVGPFAALVVDPRARRSWLARDPLGGRPLCFRLEPGGAAVASRASRLRPAADSASILDPATVVRFLAARGPRPGATFFRSVREVPAGRVLELGPDGVVAERELELRPAPPPGRGAERDWEERFRSALDEAVGCRLPAAARVAVLMSGGLDSTAVAATARRRAPAGAAPPLAISWVFERLPTADESRWIHALVDAHGLAARPIVGDELGPVAAEPDWRERADAPVLDPHWRLHERAHQVAAAEGCPVLLTGDGGDQLWSAGREWLRDLARTGRLGALALDLARAAGFALRGGRLSHPVWNSLGRLVRPAHPRAGDSPPPWLTEEGRQLFEADPPAAEPAARDVEALLLGERIRRLRTPLHLAMAVAADRAADRQGVELRRPLRDRRLVELMLAVPPRLLYRPGETKRLLRRALADRLPDEVRRRRITTSLVPLAHRGLLLLGREPFRGVLDHPEALWPRFVRRDWLLGEAMAALDSPQDRISSVVLWNCWCLERWRRIFD